MKSKLFLSWMITALIITGSWSCTKTGYFMSESKVMDQLIRNLEPPPHPPDQPC